MGGSVVIGDGELRPGHGLRRVKHAETEACFKETLYGAIDIGGREKTVRNGEGQGNVFGTATQIRACLDRKGGGLFESENEAVALMNVTDGPAIGNNIACEAPLVAQRVKEKMIGAGGLTAHGVVGAHDGIGVAFHDRGAEGGSVCVSEVAGRNRHIEAVAQSFRAAVYSVMLGR